MCKSVEKIVNIWDAQLIDDSESTRTSSCLKQIVLQKVWK